MNPATSHPTDGQGPEKIASQGVPETASAECIEMPAPTVWPMVVALALMLTGSGFVLNFAFSAAGVVLFVVAMGGWIRELLPGAGVEEIALPPRRDWVPPPQPSSRRVAAERLGVTGHRLRLPETAPPYKAGVYSGICGGVAMAIVATTFGLVSRYSIWYPVNLLGAMVLPNIAQMSTQQFDQFHLGAFLLGTLIHGCASLSAGLFFALILPMLPGKPIFWGGVVFPIFWTGSVYAFMNVLNPALDARVDWTWFIVSQFAFGLTAGFVIERFEKVRVSQT